MDYLKTFVEQYKQLEAKATEYSKLSFAHPDVYEASAAVVTECTQKMAELRPRIVEAYVMQKLGLWGQACDHSTSTTSTFYCFKCGEVVTGTTDTNPVVITRKEGK